MVCVKKKPLLGDKDKYQYKDWGTVPNNVHVYLDFLLKIIVSYL